MDLTVRPLTSGHWPALEDLFGRAGASNGCWCMAELAWLAGSRFLRAGDDLPVWWLPCFYVRRTYRGRGVMAALIEAAVPAAAAGGAPALEAYPVDTAVPGHTRNLFPGVAATGAARPRLTAGRRPRLSPLRSKGPPI